MPGFLSSTLPEQLMLSYLVGSVGGRVLQPSVQFLENDAWLLAAVRPPDAILLAAGVAQGQVGKDAAYHWAKQQGFDTGQMDAMVNIANVGPGTAYAFELWRRNIIGEPGFRRAIQRLGLEQEWIDDLVLIKNRLITPEQAAVMIQRSVIPNQGQLPGVKPAAAGQVPRFGEVQLDGYAAANAYGYTDAELDALTRIQGLPPGMDLVARMVFRKILDRGDFNLAAEQANRRVEWADFEFEGYRQIPTAEQFVEAHLRGWIDKPTMYKGTRLHGMVDTDADLEYQIHRRPLTVRQITQALAWGGQFNPEAGEITDPYSASVHQANLGPEWYGLAESLRHTYSVPFWWRSMVSAGDIAPPEAETILLRLGNPPAFAANAVAHFAGGTAAAADPHVAKAQTQLWTTTHASYKAREITDPDATTALGAVGVAPTAIPAVLTLWKEERSLIRKQLSPTQIRKALNLGIVNPATGAPWTQADAVAALLARGYDQADADVLLQE